MAFILRGEREKVDQVVCRKSIQEDVLSDREPPPDARVRTSKEGEDVAEEYGRDVL